MTLTDRPKVAHEACLKAWERGERVPTSDEPTRFGIDDLYCELCFRRMTEPSPDKIEPLGELRLPILRNHDPTRPIGKITLRDGFMEIQLQPEHALTEAQFYATFGNCGLQLLEIQERDGVEFVVKARVMEFSVPQEGAR